MFVLDFGSVGTRHKSGILVFRPVSSYSLQCVQQMGSFCQISFLFRIMFHAEIAPMMIFTIVSGVYVRFIFTNLYEASCPSTEETVIVVFSKSCLRR